MDALLTHSSDSHPAKGAALAEEYDGNMTITNDEIHSKAGCEDAKGVISCAVHPAHYPKGVTSGDDSASLYNDGCESGSGKGHP